MFHRALHEPWSCDQRRRPPQSTTWTHSVVHRRYLAPTAGALGRGCDVDSRQLHDCHLQHRLQIHCWGGFSLWIPLMYHKPKGCPTLGVGRREGHSRITHHRPHEERALIEIQHNLGNDCGQTSGGHGSTRSGVFSGTWAPTQPCAMSGCLYDDEVSSPPNTSVSSRYYNNTNVAAPLFTSPIRV